MRDISIFSVRSLWIALPLVLLSTGSSSAQGKRGVKQPTFRGTLKVGNVPVVSDSINIQYIKPYSPLGTVTSKAYAVTDHKGNFSFILPRFSEPIKIIINVKHGNKSIRVNNGYLVEPTDDIRVDISKSDKGDALRFFGFGATKYNLINRLDSLMAEFGKRRNEIKLFEPSELTGKLVVFNQLTEQFERQKIALIAKTDMPLRIKRLITYEFGNFFTLWDGAYRQYYSLNYRERPDLRALLRESFNEYKERFTYSYDSLMVNCRSYLFGLALREAREMLLNSPANVVDLERYYKVLTGKYRGKVRERLVANFFIGNAGLSSEFNLIPSVHDSLMADGEKYITTSLVKKIYSDKLRLARGRNLLGTWFTGIDNKPVSTDSLRGKVVLLDIWAVGCSWCAVFHKGFHEDVFPGLKGNRDFVYLSINTDRDRDRWFDGIKGGLYTSSEYMNVYTGALGINHPFMKYYNIQSLPFMLVIDKMGRIYSSGIGDPKNALKTIKDLLAQ